MLVRAQYAKVLIFFLTVWVVTFTLTVVSLLLMPKRYSRAKVSSYECGFEPFNDARRSFYVNFYNLGLMFLLFDVELILLLPSFSALAYLTSWGLMFIIFFVFILALGYIYEILTHAMRLRR